MKGADCQKPLVFLCFVSPAPLIVGVKKVLRMAGLGRFQSEFRANSERTPSSEQIPGKFRANSEQASQTLYFLVILCNESPWLADNRERISPWGATDHARNSAIVGVKVHPLN